MKYCVYILLNDAKGGTYIGCTSNLAQRLRQHHAGSSPYTQSRGPFHLAWFAFFSDKDRAYRFEKHLKTGSGRAFAKKHLV